MDIGGTFTDVVTYDQQDGVFAASKASTTPGNLSDGVLVGLDAVVERPADIDFLVHGTTQGLNAFLERRGVPVLLLGMCRFGWAVPGGTGHVCYQNHGHLDPHRCSSCGLENSPASPRG
jgi:hypothetical protein